MYDTHLVDKFNTEQSKRMKKETFNVVSSFAQLLSKKI